MPVILRIAFRNLKEHRSKSLIIGIIMAVGVMILVIGNTLINTIDTGIERSFIDNYTGNIMITGITESPVSLFGVQSPGGLEETPVVPDYDSIIERLDGLEPVEDYTPQITGFGIINSEAAAEGKGPYMGLLFGVDPEDYRRLFENTLIDEGRYLQPGETGLLMSRSNLDTMNEVLETEIGVGDNLLITSPGSAGFKIREVPIRGIYRLKFESEAAEYISFIDAQTLRVLKGMNLGNASEVELSEDETMLLDADSFDSFFTGEFDSEIEETSFELTEDGLFSILDGGDSGSGDSAEAKSEDIAAEASAGSTWEYILVKTRSQRTASGLIAGLNLWFSENGIPARASDWKAAAGPFSTTADVIRIVFNVAIMLVAVVAIIIMTNTLVINVVERTAEIGTMRALGARRGFVRLMISAEVFTISIIFGLLGMIAGIIVLIIVGLIGFEATNAFLEILFAGPVLRPVFSVSSVFGSWLTVIIIGMIANIYPLRLALKVQPVKAMMSE